ncbi:helix-turn-helix transcriptional regulator [Catenulispora rubra]|uniref:helix-turn-helix transcriptional regulator n=1 Tax=Catenulispora rubra TaxID=280293 RepID=UPI0018927222|nr:transcriptional regulator [Catenulispora rubra]
MVRDPTPFQAGADAGVQAVAALADAQRRRLFGFVRSARRPVTREEAAADAGISPKLAAFHLDKLVAADLLTARYDNPGGVRKVGRKPKVYEPSDTDIQVSIPERRPDVIAEILIDAVLTEQPGEGARAAALRAARGHGQATGAAERARTRPGRLGPERSLSAGEAVLERWGFEPDRQAPTRLRLLNCPFHHLAARSPELVCGINHAFVCGVLDGLETTGLDAMLAPRPGQCCVELRETPVDGAEAVEPPDGDRCARDHDG